MYGHPLAGLVCFFCLAAFVILRSTKERGSFFDDRTFGANRNLLLSCCFGHLVMYDGMRRVKPMKGAGLHRSRHATKREAVIRELMLSGVYVRPLLCKNDDIGFIGSIGVENI